MDRVVQNLCCAFVHWRDFNSCDALCAGGDGDGGPAHHLDAGGADGLDQLALEIAAKIDHHHMRPGALKRQCRAIGIVIVGEDDGAVAGDNAITGDIAAHSARKHHARKVVSGEYQRALVRALRKDGLAGPHFPHALARQVGGALAKMVGHPLGQGDVVMVHIAEHGGARQQRNLGHRLEFGHHTGNPVGRRLAVDGGVGFAEKPAAELVLLVGKDHAGAGTACLECGHQAGGAATGDQHVAMGIRLFIAVRVVMVVSHLAEAGGVADHMLIGHPHGCRPHEGLVVKARREEALQDRVHRADVELQRREAVLALCVKAVIKLDLGGTEVRLGPGAATDADERVRLFRSDGDDAARTVVLEGTADKMDVVGEQRRGERVALIALIALAVEREGERACAVDPAAIGGARDLVLRTATKK